MRHIVIAILTFLSLSLNAGKRTSTLIMPHSPSVDAARELAGWENRINVLSSNVMHGAFAVTPEVTLSFRPERIAQCFFGDSIVKCKNRLTIKGSQAPERANDHWLADYFGLATDFESSVYVRPKVSQAILDLDLHLELNKFVPGLFFRIHAPICYARWDLGFCETVLTTGTNSHDAGYFNSSGIPRVQLVDNFTSFISGNDAPKANWLTFQKLKYATMNCQAERITKLSDIQLSLGYNLLHTKRYHLGGSLRATIPTGNAPSGILLFEPIVGNGHHWELGGGLSAHILVWENPETEENCGLYFDMNISHMFESDQIRSFDLCGSSNSRYMLAQRMNQSIENNLRGVVNGERVVPNVQYQQEVAPVANLTTLPVKVTASVQADLAIMIGYQKERNNWGFGYSFWGRSCEDIELYNLIPFEMSSWGLKGDSYVFGFENDGSDTPVTLSATQSKATVNCGKNFVKSGAITAAQIAQGKQNPKVDNPFPAVADSNNDGIFNQLRTAPGGSDQINTSIQPVLLTRKDLDINSARTRGRSHKIFSHITHTIHLENSQPYLGIGAEIEFGQSSACNNAVQVGEIPCVNTALSVWGVWLKGGIAF